jgi:hypothetical protein
VGDRFDETPATEWTFEIESGANGTVLRERMRHLREGRTATRTDAESRPDQARSIIADRRKVLEEDMRATLTAMCASIEQA